MGTPATKPMTEDPKLIEELNAMGPEDLLRWAWTNYGDRAGIITSFQNAGTVTIDMASRVAPDLRGFRGPGLAFGSPNVEGTTMDAYAGDVLALMAHLEIDRAVIGGLSMGGYVAMAIARKAPQRVAGLVLANTRAGADSAEGLAARDQIGRAHV